MMRYRYTLCLFVLAVVTKLACVQSQFEFVCKVDLDCPQSRCVEGLCVSDVRGQVKLSSIDVSETSRGDAGSSDSGAEGRESEDRFSERRFVENKVEKLVANEASSEVEGKRGEVWIEKMLLEKTSTEGDFTDTSQYTPEEKQIESLPEEKQIESLPEEDTERFYRTEEKKINRGRCKKMGCRWLKLPKECWCRLPAK